MTFHKQKVLFVVLAWVCYIMVAQIGLLFRSNLPFLKTSLAIGFPLHVPYILL